MIDRPNSVLEVKSGKVSLKHWHLIWKLRIRRNYPNKEVLKSSSGRGRTPCFGRTENQVCLEYRKKTAAEANAQRSFPHYEAHHLLILLLAHSYFLHSSKEESICSTSAQPFKMNNLNSANNFTGGEDVNKINLL